MERQNRPDPPGEAPDPAGAEAAPLRAPFPEAERIPGLEFRLEEESSSRRRLELTVPAAVFESAVQAELRQIRRRVRLRGFRRGKAPRERIEQLYGTEAADQALERLLGRATRESLYELDVHPLDVPRADTKQAARGGPLTVRMSFSVWPEIGAVDFSGIKATARQSSVTESEIGETLEEMRLRAAGRGPLPDRGIHDNDFVLGDLEETDAAEDAGATRKTPEVALSVGTGAYHPALHEALQGARVGDTVIATAHFAEDSPDPERAGRTVRAQFTVKDAKAPVLPALDDDFARKLGANSLLALRGDIRDRLRQRAAADDSRELHNRLAEALLEKNPVEPPKPLVERDLEKRLRLVAGAMARQGAPKEQVEADLARHLPGMRAECEKAVATAILLDALAEQERIEASEEAVSEHIRREAEAEKRAPAVLRAAMEKDGRLEGIRTGLRRDATMDFLRDKAKVTTV